MAAVATTNHLFYIITGILTVLATIPDEVLVLVPAKYKPYVVAAGVIAMWIKGHINLFTMPPSEPPKEPPAK